MPYPDDKHIVDNRDRRWVSRTEPYELRYFIDAYLQARNFEVSERNRDIIRRAVMAYPATGPILRETLVAHLDRLYVK